MRDEEGVWGKIRVFSSFGPSGGALLKHEVSEAGTIESIRELGTSDIRLHFA